MTTTNPDPSYEDLVRVVKRDHFVKQQLSGRLAALIQENLELVSMLQEQGEVSQPSHTHEGHTHSNGEVPVEEQRLAFRDS